MDGYTLFMRKSIHDPSGECYQRSAQDMNPIAATYSISTRSQSRSHLHHIITLTPKWKDQTRGPMDRCAHASGIVRITHTLQCVVCTLSLGSKSRTTGLGSARQNKAPQSRWPSIHASLTFHIRFSLSSSAASLHLQYSGTKYLLPGIIPRPYIIAAKHIQQEQL